MPRGASRGFKIAIGLIFAGVVLALWLPFIMLPMLPDSLETDRATESPSSPPTDASASPPESTADNENVASVPEREPEPEPEIVRSPSRERREHQAVEELYERLGLVEPSDTDRHLELAANAIRTGRFNQAAHYLDEAERRGESSGDIASYRAMLYWSRGERNRAVDWARRAIRAGSRVDLALMHYIVGEAHYFAQELPRAIEEFETALDYRNDPTIRASLEKARRDARTAYGFTRQRLSHFIVSYEGETMESVGRMAMDTLERNYASLVADLGFEPSEPVTVVLYTRRSYREMGGPHWSAGGFDGKIRIPVKDIPWGDSTIRRTLHHELAHAFIHSRAGRNVPRWLNEGIAQHVEGVRTRTVAQYLRPHVAADTNLRACIAYEACGYDVFYAASASLIDYLVQLRGLGGIRDVLDGLADGDDINSCLRRTYGQDPNSLIREWERFLQRRV